MSYDGNVLSEEKDVKIEIPEDLHDRLKRNLVRNRAAIARARRQSDESVRIIENATANIERSLERLRRDLARYR